ncbi:MAG: hypothetical protein CM15mP117_23240 [Alphaproteobacteria bacterium]|nr:MAG: hypothetical protein CM15mP117_23240 [Alphaproteobacteria bacterium]
MPGNCLKYKIGIGVSKIFYRFLDLFISKFKNLSHINQNFHKSLQSLGMPLFFDKHIKNKFIAQYEVFFLFSRLKT